MTTEIVAVLITWAAEIVLGALWLLLWVNRQYGAWPWRRGHSREWRRFYEQTERMFAASDAEWERTLAEIESRRPATDAAPAALLTDAFARSRFIGAPSAAPTPRRPTSR